MLESGIFNDVLFYCLCILGKCQGRNCLWKAEVGWTKSYDKVRKRVVAEAVF